MSVNLENDIREYVSKAKELCANIPEEDYKKIEAAVNYHSWKGLDDMFSDLDDRIELMLKAIYEDESLPTAAKAIIIDNIKTNANNYCFGFSNKTRLYNDLIIDYRHKRYKKYSHNMDDGLLHMD